MNAALEVQANRYRRYWSADDVEELVSAIGHALAHHQLAQQSDLGNPGAGGVALARWSVLGGHIGRTPKGAYDKACQGRRFAPNWDERVEAARLAELERIALRAAIPAVPLPTVTPNVASALADLRQAKVLVARALAALGAE